MDDASGAGVHIDLTGAARPKRSLLSTLWLDCGPEFLQAQHDALSEEILRLQNAAAGADRRIIDLREPPDAPITAEHRCHKHMRCEATVRCKNCRLLFCDDCVVRGAQDIGPMCHDCAFIAAGIRTARRRPRA